MVQPSYVCPTQDFQLSQWRKTHEGKWNALSLSEMHQVFNSTTGQIFLKCGMKIHGPQNCIELNLVTTWSFLWCHLGAKISNLTQEISQEFTVTFTQHIHAPLRTNLNLVFLHAEVVGAAGHVGQRADKVVAALKWRIQQHCTHLLHFLQPQNRFFSHSK